MRPVGVIKAKNDIGRRTSAGGPAGGPAETARMTPRDAGTTASAAPSRSRSGRAGAGLGWGGAGILPRVGEVQVREDLPDDGGIVEGGDQA